MGKEVFILLFCVGLSVVLQGCEAAWPSQPPFWPLYPNRNIQVLDGAWEFGYTSKYPGDVTSTTINTNAIETSNTTEVPSAFDYLPPGYEGPRGTAFYRTQITIPPGQTALINFAACSFYCNVYVDNKQIGDHRAGGYSPFWLTIPPSSAANRTLFVLSDNRWNSTTAPVHTGGDFYFFGGIHRSVIVHTSPVIGTLFIQRLEVLTTDYTVDAISTILTETGMAQGGVYVISTKVPEARLWNIGSPNLHLLTVALMQDIAAVDTIQTRIGIRQLEIDSGSRLNINGQRVKLHGHNRHTMAPDTGPAMTIEQIITDVKILMDLGSNYVRGAHYPQDQRFLDLCDEVGIVIWEEALGPGVSVANIQSPYFMQYQLQQMNEMIDASFNHPSVIFHGFFNEGPSNEVAACPGYEACVNVVHQRNEGRYATWADNQLLSDQCLKYADIISFNAYPGWYDHSGNYTYPLSFWPSILAQAAQQYTQPITVSETGCEGLFEWINTTSVPWGQEFQLQVVPNDVKAILSDERVTGLTLWVFADFKGNDGAQAECGPCQYYPGTNNATWKCNLIVFENGIDINVSCDGKCGFGCRPCGENHKGTVDFWRRNKLVYDAVQTLYNQQWP